MSTLPKRSKYELTRDANIAWIANHPLMKEINDDLARMRDECHPPHPKPKPRLKYPDHVPPVCRSDRLGNADVQPTPAGTGPSDMAHAAHPVVEGEREASSHLDNVNDTLGAIDTRLGASIDGGPENATDTGVDLPDTDAMDVDKDVYSDVLPSRGAASTSEVSPSSESGSQVSVSSEKDMEDLPLPNDTDGDIDMEEQAGGNSGVDTPPNNSSSSPTETPDASDNLMPPPVSPERQSPSPHPLPKLPIPRDDGTRHSLPIETDILTKCPDWFATVYRTFGNNTFGDAFASLLWSWAFLEKKKEFTGPQVAFTAKERPELLCKWIGRGRFHKGNNMPRLKAGDSGKFQEEWSTWWRELQPSWREESPNRGWERGIYGDDWGSLSVGGQNGWLGVIACLFWWGNAVWVTEDGDISSWAEAVKDVKWILKGVLASIE